MFEIIIIFIIVSVIGNILKGIGQASQRGKPRQPVPGRTADYEKPLVGDTSADFDRYGAGRADIVYDRLDDISAEEGFRAGGQSVYESYDFDMKPANTQHSPGRRNKLSFSRDSIINGIILSEILQPPKSRRRI